jgi:rhodanese-related sulfurtransferase
MSRPTVSPCEAADLIADGACALEVREPVEWATAHIDGAMLIPLGDLPARAAELPSDGPVVVVCRSGNRSSVATDVLRAAGRDAYNLDGGMIAWTAAGLPTVAG